MNKIKLSPLSVRITKTSKSFISRFLDITPEDLDTYSDDQVKQMVQNTVEQMPEDLLRQFEIELAGRKSDL